MRRLDDLTIEVKQMNLNISQTYLRKDVYESETALRRWNHAQNGWFVLLGRS